jgi:Secretion system C-terminal sorting domain/Beta-propeller repeat
MRKILLFLGVLALNQANSQINVLWESRFNGTDNNIERVADMFVDASGNVFVTGSSYSTTTGFDIVTIKYNSSGVQQWISTFNGTGNGTDNASGLAVDASGNVFVSGTSYIAGTNYDFTVIKYNSLGVQQWQVYNGSGFYDETRDIALDNSGAPVVVGGFQSSASNTNFRTLKLNAATGATTWFQDFSNSTSLDIAVAVTIDAIDNVFVTGHSFQSGQDLNVRTIKYNSAGVVAWSTQHNENTVLNSYDMPAKIVAASSGEVFVLATVFNGSVSDDDILLIRYNSTGTVISTLEINGSANDKDKPNDLIIDASGNIYIAGILKGAATAEDYFVAKYNAAFTQLWADNFNGSGSNYDEATGITLDATGTYLYSGGYSYLTASNNDYLTNKYDASTGVRIWSTRFNGPANNSDQARKIDVDLAGNVYVSGDSKGAGTNLDYSTIKYCQLTTTATVDQDTVCTGTLVNFNVTGGSTILWTGTGLSCTTCATPTHTTISDVCYQVSTQDATGCIDLDTVCVVVNPLPGPVITPDGPTSFCQGDSVGLTASGFATYTWNTGETTPTIVADTSGTYTVTVTDGIGCANFTNIVVTVNNPPVINAGLDQDHCPGDTSQLIATGGVSYVWNSDPFISSTTNDSTNVFPSVSGTYTYIVTGTDGNGCVNSDTVSVTVFTTPSQPIIFWPPGDIIYITNYTGGMSWYMNGVYFPDAGSGVQLDLADTSLNWACQDTNYYSAIHTDANGCLTVYSDTIEVIDTTYNNADCYIGIHEADLLSNFNVYPNPTNGDITIEFVTGKVEDIQLSLYDISGKIVYSKLYNAGSGLRRETLNLGKLGNGMYQLSMRNASGKVMNRLLVKE